MAERPRSLRIPGPIALPDQVRRVMGEQVINHRGPEFAERIEGVTEKLQRIFKTESDVLMLTASGTGGLEASIVNTLSPGDEVLSLSMGEFGDRFANIAAAFGAKVTQVRTLDGAAISPLEVGPALSDRTKSNQFDAVLITHNETSTGVTNDLEHLVRGVKLWSPSTLVLVDAVSSIPSVDLRMDDWGCDVVVSASQKGWGAPPGLTMIGVSPLAWEAYEKSTLPKNYFDFGAAKEFLKKGQTPFTPAVLEIAALDTALDMIFEEGHDTFLERHHLIAEYVRGRLEHMGLKLFADSWRRSDTITSIEHHRPGMIVEAAREAGVELAGGQGELKSSIFRVGHMGFHTIPELKEDLDILSLVI